MEFKKNSGQIYYFKTDKTKDPKSCFSPILEVNSNLNKLNCLTISYKKALGITSNNELFLWNQEKEEDFQEQNDNKINNNYFYLSTKPHYLFRKIKFKSINLNKSVCLGLDTNGNVLVWGQSNEGILGLGYDISNVEEPTILEDLKEIIDISLSDHHAIAINSSGNAYSWGTGKYGELGLERSIYSPVPQQILTDTCYSKVFCGNLISCFLDSEGHFYYFGVVIKQLSGACSTITTKSLLDEQIYFDGKILFLEKQIEELENQKFSNIIIGNGFIGLLTIEGVLFTLEYNDKLTKLYSKYNLYNISLASNKIFGLAKEPKNTTKYNYYLLRWVSTYSSENDLYSDSWHTTMWKFIDGFNIMENCYLLDTNIDKNILFLKVINKNEKLSNLNNTILEPNKGNLNLSNNNNIINNIDNSVHLNSNIDNIELGINEEFKLYINQEKIFKDKFLEFENEYDDSYNLKYKRNQSNNLFQESGGKTFILNNHFNSFYSDNKNSFFSPSMNMNKTVIFKNKSNNPLNVYSKNISSGFLDKNGIKLNSKNNTIKNNYAYNSNSDFGTDKYNNKNDISDNVNIYEIEDNNKSNAINNSKNNTLRNFKNNKNNIKKDNANTIEYNSDDNEFKEKELNKYRAEVDNIINNFKQKKKSQSFSVIGRGNKREINNNINILGKDKDNNLSYEHNGDFQNQRYTNIPNSLSNKKHLMKSKYKNNEDFQKQNNVNDNEYSSHINNINNDSNNNIPPNNTNKRRRNDDINIEYNEDSEDNK